MGASKAVRAACQIEVRSRSRHARRRTKSLPVGHQEPLTALPRFIERVLISEQETKPAQDAGCDTDHCNRGRSPLSGGGPHRGNNQLVDVTSAGSARQLCVRRPTPTNLEASFPPKEFAAIEARLPTASNITLYRLNTQDHSAAFAQPTNLV